MGYIPSKLASLGLWATNFSSLITASPTTYGLTAPNASAISSAVSPFTAALAVSTNLSTRTRATVAATQSAKAAMLAVVRPFAQTVSRNSGVTPEHKAALGVNTRTNTPSPIPAPSTNPIISVISAAPLEQTVRASDSTTPDKRAKPFGALGMLLYGKASLTPITNIDELPVVQIVTKQPIKVAFDSADRGKTMYYYGRWYNRKGQLGPASSIASFVVA